MSGAGPQTRTRTSNFGIPHQVGDITRSRKTIKTFFQQGRDDLVNEVKTNMDHYVKELRIMDISLLSQEKFRVITAT